jgi:hypothetical protein
VNTTNANEEHNKCSSSISLKSRAIVSKCYGEIGDDEEEEQWGEQ